jgi:hypothetical protein
MKVFLAAIAVALALAVGELEHLQLLTLLWIPLAMIGFLIAFPLYAVVGQSSLFHGLFDLDLSPRKRLPIRHFVATLSAFAVAASAISIMILALRCDPDRAGIPRTATSCWISWAYGKLIYLFRSPLVLLLVAENAIAAFFAIFAVATSWNQDKRGRPLLKLVLGMLLGLFTGTVAVLALRIDAIQVARVIATKPESRWLICELGPSYTGNPTGHVAAAMACLASLILYAAIGLYGWWALGKTSMVAALVGPLMVVLIVGWLGSGIQFFVSHSLLPIPLLLVVTALGFINNALPWTDHTYDLLPRNHTPAAPPFDVLIAGDRTCAILVASAGGGIQAAAWTAKVLEGLHTDLGERFDRALSFISSISGGSMGSACYLDWVHRRAPTDSVNPFTAASADSLDEVAWGLAWPDLLRALVFWPIGIDRGQAMERAWIGNANSPALENRLSDRNAPTAQGKLPALVMNSTMVEVGGPLLLGTSDVNGGKDRRRVSSCWWDGDELHVDKDKKLDISIVRAARLSATFPYVTPAARPARADHEPHMMDGGFYDNYGMATLTEWIDQALEEQARKDPPDGEQVKRVLVLQINGFPTAKFGPPAPPKGHGGWLRQLIDPIQILVSVRSAGQVSHRDVEFDMLRDKWQCRGVDIAQAVFELNEEHTPLSWHLMPKQIEKIRVGWEAVTSSPSDEKIREAKRTVANFLADC